MDADVLTISPAGQMSLPEAFVRTLSAGGFDRVVAYTIGDSVVLKPAKAPTAESLKAWMDDAQRWAASVGYVEEDVTSIVKDMRRRKHA